MLRSVFGLKKHRESDEDVALRHVFLTLQQAMMGRELVEVSLAGDDKVYQSLILELDSDEKTILIDELFPGTYQGIPGQLLSVSIRQKGGRSIKFDSVILQRHSFDDAPIYVIAMPGSLDLDQRRAAFRLPIASNIVVESRFTGPDRCQRLARLRNVSADGLCLETECEGDLKLICGDVLNDVTFELSGVYIECDATVRNVVCDEESLQPWRIGVEFVRMPIIEHRQLELAILQIQRERLRRGEHQRDQLIH